MKPRIILLFVALSGICLGQSNHSATIAKVLAEGALADKTSIYNETDLTKLFVTNSPAIGFIGDDYERLSMVLQTVSPSGDNKEFTVTGKSRVKNNVCSYKGILVIEKILQDDNGNGIATGRYHFKEDSTPSHPGVFEGVFAIRFIPDRDNVPVITNESARWNYTFTGDWSAYQGKLRMKANWGDKRIADSGDLDSGTDTFSVNKKYARSGWKTYIQATEKKDPEAINKEAKQWW